MRALLALLALAAAATPATAFLAPTPAAAFHKMGARGRALASSTESSSEAAAAAAAAAAEELSRKERSKEQVGVGLDFGGCIRGGGGDGKVDGWMGSGVFGGVLVVGGEWYSWRVDRLTAN